MEKLPIPDKVPLTKDMTELERRLAKQENDLARAQAVGGYETRKNNTWM